MGDIKRGLNFELLLFTCTIVPLQYYLYNRLTEAQKQAELESMIHLSRI